MADDKKPDGAADSKPAEKKPDTPAEKKPDATGADGKPKVEEPKPEGKDGAGAKAPEAPASYTLKRPEDELFTETDIKRYESTAKTLKLSNDQAQALVDADAAYADELREALLTDLKADKDLGGAKLDSSVADAQKGLQAFLKGSPEDESAVVKAMLERTGYGNHKALVRAFARLGRMMREDSPDGGKGGGGDAKTIAETLYGKG